MMKAIRLCSFFVLMQICSSTHINEYLNGKHLVVGLQSSPVHLYVTRNASGHIVKMQGVAMNTLSALSRRFNFTYSILQVNDTRLEKQSNTLPGLHYYMTQGKCDLVIGSIAMTLGRSAGMDLVEGYAYTSIATVIPMPEELQNADAALQPFQLPVWIGLVVMMPLTAIAIYYSSPHAYFKKQPDESATIAGSPKKGNVYAEVSSKISEAFFQVFRILMNQGASFQTNRTALYFVVGSWCLGAMVLICAYNSILTSYILGSNAKPMADSAIDAIGNSKVNIAVNDGNGVDLVLSAAEVGFYKHAGDKLRSNPESRCKTTKECINLVKSGSYAYLHTIYTAMDVIDEDYRATGVCHLALARKFEPMPGSLAWALPKNSHYTRLFSMGFMELHESGMMEHWIAWELKKYRNATQCLQEAHERQQRKAVSEEKTKITLKNFSGPFDLLILGYLVSFILFVREIFYFKVSKYCKKQLSRKATIKETDDVNGNVK
ncbi:ionotropic receptor 93a-like [Daphnia carinata]|uniref:ionotropic receptor 93a-like n=1 Tax=Daphnia carinata TaxID=120202 RepID=UPI0025806A96|nr:ionotropic receptor 93a-like [Daphnia carinata]